MIAEKKNFIIYINGPINSGKTTISKFISERINNTVHIEVDHLRHFAAFLSLSEAIPYAFEDTVLIMKNWLQRGFNAVISWPISKENFNILKENAITENATVFAFTLLPKLSVCLENRGNRELTDLERLRINEKYANWEKTAIGHVIDNSNLSVEETYMTIRNIMDNFVTTPNKV